MFSNEPETKSYLWTNLVVASFLAAFTLRTLFLSATNEIKVSKSIEGDGEKVPFDHPFL